MRLNRTDLVPVLTIVAGGLVGGLVSFSFLGPRSEDVSDVVPVSATYESYRSVEVLPSEQEEALARARALVLAKGQIEVERRRIEVIRGAGALR